MSATRREGFTLVEMLVAVAIGGLILIAINGVTSRAFQTRDLVTERNELTQDARYAMERMVRAVGRTRLLVLPLADKTITTHRENVREQSVPASPPEAGSTLATAVLAVSMDATIDRDADGYPDADNDRDGRIDEDIPGDLNNDLEDGIYQIDDDADGSVDENFWWNTDDESTTLDDDPINGLDDDADGVIDEDPGSDANGDGAPGVLGVDDDGDGTVDEGDNSDDDEDGQSDEDWIDTVVFYLSGQTLMERTPVPWDESGAGGITGRDFLTEPIAEQVTFFRVERVAPAAGASVLVDLTLELSGDAAEVVRLNTRVRVGAAQ